MPKLATVTAQSTEVTVEPKLRKRLVLGFKVYAGLKAELDALQAACDTAKAEIEACRVLVGVNSVAVDGFKATRVEGTTSRLDYKKLKAQGVTDAQIEAATVVTPKKPFTKVTVPGGKDEE